MYTLNKCAAKQLALNTNTPVTAQIIIAASAQESSLAPNSVSNPNALAIIPSKTSVIRLMIKRMANNFSLPQIIKYMRNGNDNNR
jgi:hypothetical protein